MITPWTNYTVKVQRRTTSSRNALNEPDYGTEANYPVAYASISVRIEFPDQQTEFTETGERVKMPMSAISGVDMYVDPAYTIAVEDRVTILTCDDASLIGQLYLVLAVYPENDSMGNVHHYVCELQVH